MAAGTFDTFLQPAPRQSPFPTTAPTFSHIVPSHHLVVVDFPQRQFVLLPFLLASAMRSPRVTLLLGAVLAVSTVSAHGGHGHDNLEADEVTPPVAEPATSSKVVELPTFTVSSL